MALVYNLLNKSMIVESKLKGISLEKITENFRSSSVTSNSDRHCWKF